MLLATNGSIVKNRFDYISGNSKEIIHLMEVNTKIITQALEFGKPKMLLIQICDNPSNEDVSAIRQKCLELKITATIVCKHPERIKDVVDYLILK